MKDHIQKLIDEGEHQQLDFKFEISDARKIARTLVAFANTDGGRLLIGVKDNGAIAGVRSEEEYFMLEAAASMYCRPPVEFTFQEWQVGKKTVLEVTVLRSPRRPHYAETKEKEWHAFVRVKDQNFPANRILLRVWKNENRTRGVFLHFTEAEKFLLTYLESNPGITLSGFSRKARITRNRAENILVKFLLLKIIEMKYAESQTVYSLVRSYRNA